MKTMLLILSLSGMLWFSLKPEPEHICQEQYYKKAYLKANTLLKYQDSISESGLLINLSKFQPEYVNGKMNELARKQIK